MAGILDRHNRHLLTEEENNQGNSFIANINKVANDLDSIKAVADGLDSIATISPKIDKIEAVADRIEDIIEVVSLQPSMEGILAIKDSLLSVSEKLGTIQDVYNNLSKIDFIYDKYQTITDDIHRLEALYSRITAYQSELVQLINDNRAFVTESEARITELVNQINSNVDRTTELVNNVQGIKDDIDAALRDALLPTITDEIVESASDRAVEILERQFAGNTDFVQTYVDTYNGE